MSHSSSSPGLELAFSTTENRSQEDLSEEKKILRSNTFLSNPHICVQRIQLIQNACTCA